jgi:GxxExxY protein
MNDKGITRTNTGRPRTNTALLHGEVTDKVVAAFYRLYDRLGFGFLESVYLNALAKEFTRSAIAFEREFSIDVFDLGEQVGHFRADFQAEGKVIVEVKASQAVGEADRKQLLNYLRASRMEVGLLLHFGEKPSFQRLIYTNDRKGLIRTRA